MKTYIKKSVWIFILLTVLLVFVPIHKMSAYLADGDTTVNSFVVGGNRITIEEDFDPKPVAPGETITKKVQIKNTGPNNCYIRVRAVFSDSRVGQYADVDWNRSEWVYDENDEYYYYKFPVATNETTSSLMTNIVFSDLMPSECVGDVDMLIYAESYQSYGFSNYQEAWSEYQKNMK